MNIEEVFKQNTRILYVVDGISEMNEAILILYNIIGVAIRQEADFLVLTKSEIYWERENTKLGEYPTSLSVDIDYGAELDFMLSRDSTLREYVEKLPESPTMSLRYKLTLKKDIFSKKDK